MARVADIMRRHGLLGWLVGINAVVFCFMAFYDITLKAGGSLPFNAPRILELPALWGVWAERPWTLLTYMFTHENFLHLLFNMLWLLWFGSMFLMINSNRRLLIMYLGGGIAGGLLYMMFCPLIPGLYSQFSMLLGASASVLALMSATAVLLPDYKLHLFFIGDVKLKWMALAMIILAFLGLGGGNAGGSMAHLGGVAYGLVAGLCLRRIPANTPPSPKRVKRKNPFKHLSAQGAMRVAPHNAVEREKADAARLDQLLDKIHTSGFNSLTRAEREELQALSSKITK